MKDATGKASVAGETNAQDGDVTQDNQPGPQAAAATPPEDRVVPGSEYLVSGDGNCFTYPMSWHFDNTKRSNGQGMPFSLPDMRYKPRGENAGTTNWELLGMGMFEALPPTEMIEELSVCSSSSGDKVSPVH